MKFKSIPNRLLAFTSKPTIAAVILRSSMQSNMPNFIFSIIIHHYIEWLNYSPSALRDLILAKKPFHARSTFITRKCRLDLRLKTKRVEVDWRTESTEDGCFGEREGEYAYARGRKCRPWRARGRAVPGTGAEAPLPPSPFHFFSLLITQTSFRGWLHCVHYNGIKRDLATKGCI